MSSPLNRTRPAVGLRPQMTLNSVAFPAPFGPMSPSTSPPFTESSMRSRAQTPPKLLLIALASSSGFTGVRWIFAGSGRALFDPDGPVHRERAGPRHQQHQGDDPEGEHELEATVAPEETVDQMHLDHRDRHVDHESRRPEAGQEPEEDADAADELGDGHDPGPEEVRLDSVLRELPGGARDTAAAERAQELLRSYHHEDEAQEETQDQDRQPLQPLEPLWHRRPRFLSGHSGPSPQCLRCSTAIHTAPRMPVSGPSPQRQSGG